MNTDHDYQVVTDKIVAVLRAKQLLTLAAAMNTELESQDMVSPLCRELMRDGAAMRAETFDLVFDFVNVHAEKDKNQIRATTLDQLVSQDTAMMAQELVQKIIHTRANVAKIEALLPADILAEVETGIGTSKSLDLVRKIIFQNEQENNNYTDAEMRGIRGRSFPIRFAVGIFESIQESQDFIHDFLTDAAPEDVETFTIWLLYKIRCQVNQEIELYLEQKNGN